MATNGNLNSSLPEVAIHSEADNDRVPSGYGESECPTSPQVMTSGIINCVSDPVLRGSSQSTCSTVYVGRGVDRISGQSPHSQSYALSSYESNDLKTAAKTTSRHSRYYSDVERRLSGKATDSATGSIALSLRPVHSIQSKNGSVENWYDVESPPIREGSFGKIFRAKRKEGDDEFVAVKTVAYESIVDAQDQASFEFELHVSRQLKHPNIVRIIDTIKDDGGRCWHLVMELLSGGDLFDLLKANCGPGRFKEPVLARFIYQMLDGIKYCHHHHFCHRDIKPENYMLLAKGMDSPLKLIDFGLATAFESGTIMTLRCGTLHYSAPEALRCKYTEKCDIWSIGVVFYMLCIGQWPFFDKNEHKLASMIASGPDVFGEQNATQTAAFDRASGDKVAIKALLKELLCPDAAKRPSAKEILAQNRWIAKAKELPLESQCCCGVQ